MSWLFNGLPIEEDKIPKGAVGFLYKITNTETNQWYLGRKLLTKSKQKVVNGKKKKTRVESDWKDYWSSNDTLKEEAAIAPQKFKREILLFVTTMGAMAYAEEFLLYKSGALFDPKCLNGNIRAKIMRNWFGKTPNLHKELDAVKL